jgi:hypothetical protein
MTVLKSRKKFLTQVVVQILYFDVTIYKVSIKERMYIKSRESCGIIAAL